MSKKEIKSSRGLYKILRATVGKYFNFFYGVQFDGQGIEGIKPPYLILPNHTNFWDPFLLAANISEPIYYVASDQYFRNPILRGFLKMMGTIPKTKFFSDISTVKHILKIKKRGGIIGIFPEGARNWDGRTMELVYPTAKLIKSLKIPVVTVLVKGAYLSLPRWTSKSRRGKVFIFTKKLMESSEIARLSVDDIHKKLTEGLAYDEYTWQRQHRIPFKGTKLAENLELLLFVCPHCKSMDTLKSSGSLFSCADCGYSVEMDEYGFFNTQNKILYFDNPADWNAWGLQYLKESLDRYQKEDCHRPFMEQNKVILWKGGRRSTSLKKIRVGQISLYKDRMVFSSLLGDTIIFPIDRLQGVNVHLNNKIELYHGNILYRFVFKRSTVSAYKWVMALNMLNKAKHVRH
jgi:1-acyl-sn-glycerol-3-phosphate acyltransferase